MYIKNLITLKNNLEEALPHLTGLMNINTKKIRVSTERRDAIRHKMGDKWFSRPSDERSAAAKELAAFKFIEAGFEALQLKACNKALIALKTVDMLITQEDYL